MTFKLGDANFLSDLDVGGGGVYLDVGGCILMLGGVS